MGVFREKCDRSIAFAIAVLCAITCHVVPRYIESLRLSIHRGTTWHNIDAITLWNLTGRLITVPHRTPCPVSQHHPCLPRLEIIPLQPFYPNLKQFKRMSCLMGLLCLHKSQGTQKSWQITITFTFTSVHVTRKEVLLLLKKWTLFKHHFLWVNTLKPKQNGWYFAGDIFLMSFTITLMFVRTCPIKS